MRWALTTHAIDRWQARIEPHLNFVQTRERLLALIPTAQHIGSTRKGQLLYRLRDQDAEGFAVVKPSPQLRQPSSADGVVVTILDHQDVNGGGEEELLAAWEELQATLPPPAWKPRPFPPSTSQPKPPQPALPIPPKVLKDGPASDQEWALFLGQLERNRRIVEHYRHEVMEVAPLQQYFRDSLELLIQQKITPEALLELVHRHFPGAYERKKAKG